MQIERRDGQTDRQNRQRDKQSERWREINVCERKEGETVRVGEGAGQTWLEYMQEG